MNLWSFLLAWTSYSHKIKNLFIWKKKDWGSKITKLREQNWTSYSYSSSDYKIEGVFLKKKEEKTSSIYTALPIAYQHYRAKVWRLKELGSLVHSHEISIEISIGDWTLYSTYEGCKVCCFSQRFLLFQHTLYNNLTSILELPNFGFCAVNHGHK